MVDEHKLKVHAQRLKKILLRAIFGFDANDLTRVLARLGVAQGDTIMVHGGLQSAATYTGSLPELVEAFLAAVGPTGTVAMQSMSYFNMRSADYLASRKPFDVRRSISMMGLISEAFRRRPDVRRSLHPTHPIATWGARGDWLVEGQGKELAPFGRLSPFARLIEAQGKVVMFGVGITSMTFVCHLEHLFQDFLPVPLYEPEPYTGTVIDYDGIEHGIQCLVLSKESSEVRNVKRLEAFLLDKGALKTADIGRTKVMVGDANAMLALTEDLIRHRGGFHDNPPKSMQS